MRSTAMRSVWLVGVAACGGAAPVERPAPGALAIDRFSRAAAHLMIRDATHPLPAAGAPIDLDVPPFVTQGLGPAGNVVRYYNFDVQRADPDTLYRIVRPGSRAVIAEIVDAVPGDPTYSDFHRIAWVEVAAAATPTRAAELAGLPTTLDPTAIDCPIVPRGSHGKGGGEPHEIWYRGAKLVCLAFGEPLLLDHDKVPTSPIYVTFGEAGFKSVGPQTHNVVFSVPGDTDYSPLWAVHVYVPEAFAAVHDAASAEAAKLLEAHGPLVNCPIISH